MFRINSDRISDEILDRFQSGDKSAFEYIYTQTCERMYFFALRMLRDKGAAEDITADTFTKLWIRRGEITDCRKLISYLYKMVYNACLTCIAKRKCEGNRYKVIEYMMRDRTESNIEHEIIRTELVNEIYQAMKALPPKCGQIFEYLILENKSYSEIAKEMNVAVGTIRAQKVRGLVLLRKMFRVSEI